VAHFDQIGETGLDQVLAKRLTTPGGAVAPTVAPELFPVLTLENDRPEWGYLKGEFRYFRALTPTAPAASSHVILRNPANSSLIAVLERVTGSTTAGALGISMAPIGNFATGAASATGVPRDGRYSAFAGGVFTRTSQLVVFSADAALAAVAEGFRTVSTTLDFSDPIILTPGFDLAIYGRTAAASILVNLMWSERRAQPSEL